MLDLHATDFLIHVANCKRAQLRSAQASIQEEKHDRPIPFSCRSARGKSLAFVGVGFSPKLGHFEQCLYLVFVERFDHGLLEFRSWNRFHWILEPEFFAGPCKKGAERDEDVAQAFG